MRLWDKGEALDALVARFTVGDDPEVDLNFAWHDLVGSAAHVRVQLAAGMLEPGEAEVLLAGLRSLMGEVERGEFRIPQEEEDVHTAIESRLTERLGPVAGKLHTGRSRNDQVLTAVRLWTKEALADAEVRLDALIGALLTFAAQHEARPLTGYTHLQRAMPSSWGQWAGGYANALLDVRPLYAAAWALADRCPLGSAAGYGTPLPLDRALAAQLLGFGVVEAPETSCQLTRGLVEAAVLSALGAATGLVGRLAWDVTLFASAEFGLLRLPAALTTGSSIMPQKRNPDVAELLRGVAVKVKATRREIEDIVALPSGYHRDLQLTKAPFVRGVVAAQDAVEVAARLVAGLEPVDQPLDPVLFATAAAFSRPEPFREAYGIVGKQVLAGTFVAEPGLRGAPPVDVAGLSARRGAPAGAAGLRERWRGVLG